VETILLNALAGNYRREVVNGREFIVAPLVSIVPGVLNGSKGALFYPEDEISRDPQAWNGMPLVKGHPTKNGQPISGRDPWVRANLQMGTIYNSVYDGRLQHEAWFDVEDTKRVDNWVYQQLISNGPIEVSTGLFTDNEPFRGTHNNKPYEYVARNYRPDHMAILVGQRGACSNKDGCGINVRNEEKRSIWTKLGELLGLVANEACCEGKEDDEKCEDCKAALNAGVYGNPQSTATGKFKQYNAGTGKGDVHEAAQSGAMLFTDEDRQRGTVDPTTWVADESKWEKAKAAADKGGHSEDKYLTVVSHIYRKMGGTVKESVANWCNQHGGDTCSEGGGGEGGGESSSTEGGSHLSKFNELNKKVDDILESTKEQSYDKTSNLTRLKDYPVKEIEEFVASLDKSSTDEVKGLVKELKLRTPPKASKSSLIEQIKKRLMGPHQAWKANLNSESGVNNSRQSDFIDCQEECDDMDCVDECLADFIGNSQTGETMATPTRDQAIQTLTTNCDCWKGKQEVLANKDSFSDEDIQRLLKAFNARKLAVNTLREIGAATGAPATLTVNEMPAFIKAKMGKKEDEEVDPEEEEEEEEPMMNKSTKNAAKKSAPITERLSPDELEVWNNAVQITANEKKKIVKQLVANLEGDYRKEKYTKLMKKSMDDLREMLELRGTYNSGDRDEETFVSNGIGGFFTPDFDDTHSPSTRTDNADDDDGAPLGLPGSHATN
jgi:hypothetical protein